MESTGTIPTGTLDFCLNRLFGRVCVQDFKSRNTKATREAMTSVSVTVATVDDEMGDWNKPVMADGVRII